LCTTPATSTPPLASSREIAVSTSPGTRDYRSPTHDRIEQIRWSMTASDDGAARRHLDRGDAASE
jgi:hypothetical protein